MASSFSAELLKLRKRPGTWMLGLIFVALTLLFGYLFNYLLIDGTQDRLREELLSSLLPESFLTTVIGTFSDFGAALALILGALVMGSEYGWDTFKVSLTQRPGRLSFFAGKLLTVGVLLLIITVVVLAVGAGASYAVAASKGAAVEWPSALEMLKGIGAGWLILATFATLGTFLATLFRGTALAIGIGLVYLLVLENLFLQLAGQSETTAAIGERLPAKSATDLPNYFGQIPEALGGGFGEIVEPTTAVLTLGIYTALFVALTVLLFKSRDVN